MEENTMPIWACYTSAVVIFHERSKDDCMIPRTDVAHVIEHIDHQRRRLGFLTIQQLIAQVAANNTILDPFSVLISSGVEVGTGNIFYPNVVLEIRNHGNLSLGDNNYLHPQTFVLADTGQIDIGDGNQFGDGGVTIKVVDHAVRIRIQDNGRYVQGADIVGQNSLGSGTQILGPITVQNCTLEAGGSYEHPDPDQRGGVLKGSGIARNITVRRGEVINRRVLFDQAEIERQTVYHPK